MERAAQEKSVGPESLWYSEPPRPAMPEATRARETKRHEKFFDAASVADQGDFVFSDEALGTAVLVAGGEEVSPELVQKIGAAASKGFERRIKQIKVDEQPDVVTDIIGVEIKQKETTAMNASIGAHTEARDVQLHDLLRHAVTTAQLDRPHELAGQ